MKTYVRLCKAVAIGLTITAILVWGVAALGAVNFRQLDYPGAISAYAFDVNRSGQVVGYYSVNPGSGLVYRGFLYDGVTFTPLEVPGASNTHALAINDSGRLVGAYFIGDMSNWDLHGFSYQDGHYTYPLDNPESLRTSLNDINNLGQMVGSFVGLDGLEFGFFYDGVAFTPIYAYGISPGEAVGLNDPGKIVGYYVEPDTGFKRGYKLEGSNLTPIDVPGGPGVTIIGTSPSSISNAGKIAGNYTAAGPSGTFVHGFTFDGVTYRSFDIPGAGNTFLSRLKDNGRMVGYFYTGSTGSHGFVATVGAGPAIDLLLLN
jgi:uncharacterized membrane protein